MEIKMILPDSTDIMTTTIIYGFPPTVRVAARSVEDGMTIDLRGMESVTDD